MQKFLGIFLLIGVLFSTMLFSGEIILEKDIVTAFSKAKKENKVVMILVEGEYCKWCKRMKHRTLSDESVLKRLKPYILVKVMREDENAVKNLPAINGVPTIFFMTADKKVLESVVGYFNVEDFISYINDIEKKVPLDQ